MASLIASAYQKLVRAKAHSAALHEMDRRLVRSPYVLIPETTGDPDEIEYRLRLPKIPEQYPMLVADCIHNLRCVLDHLVSQLADHHAPGRTVAERRQNQFPICETATDFERQVRRGRLNGCPSELTAVIASFQPFRPDSEWLGVLNELENQDKHRSVMVVGSVARSIFSAPLEARGISLPFKSWADPVLDGAVFVRLHRQWVRESFDELRRTPVEASGAIQVVFLEGTAAGWDVPGTLDHFTERVERDVVASLRPYFTVQAG